MEFNLSEKMVFKGSDDNFHYDKDINDCIEIKDVKEFIRLLKEELPNYKINEKYPDMKELMETLWWGWTNDTLKIIDKLAGDKLL